MKAIDRVMRAYSKTRELTTAQAEVARQVGDRVTFETGSTRDGKTKASNVRMV
jgi:hypothetical protein